MRKNRKNYDLSTPPVKKIDVDDKHRKPKLVLIVVLLALGLTLIVTSIVGLLKTEPGWTTIQANVTSEESCSGDFQFQYYLGAGDRPANLEQRELTQLYSDATKTVFEIFHEDQLFNGVNNVCYLNQHVNEVVQVPKVLYDAFALLEEHGTRALFAAPLYWEYIGLCLSDQDAVAETYDPDKDALQQEYFAEVLAFTNDETAVSLQLMGDNQVKLCVSDEYLEYAQTHEITEFISFYWLKNAFIADYLAETLIAAGYTNGIISSFDGFSRNLDVSAQNYRMNLFDRVGGEVYVAGALEYSGATAFVSLHSYPMSELAVQQYYTWKDGSVTSCYIDPADGRDKTAVNDLLGYSKNFGCAEVLLELIPAYVAESLDVQALEAAETRGVHSIYCEGRKIYCSNAVAVLVDIYSDSAVTYEKG